jgi:hypothetical protein
VFAEEFKSKEAHVQGVEGFAAIWRNAQLARSEWLRAWSLNLLKAMATHSWHLAQIRRNTRAVYRTTESASHKTA